MVNVRDTFKDRGLLLTVTEGCTLTSVSLKSPSKYHFHTGDPRRKKEVYLLLFTKRGNLFKFDSHVSDDVVVKFMSIPYGKTHLDQTKGHEE